MAFERTSRATESRHLLRLPDWNSFFNLFGAFLEQNYIPLWIGKKLGTFCARKNDNFNWLYSIISGLATILKLTTPWDVKVTF
jgi:hypothetical protein